MKTNISINERDGGVYVHIPFCVEKCDYCDFLSFGGVSERQKAAYVDALCEQIQLHVNVERKPISTVYIGGGTPTALSLDQLQEVLSTVFVSFPLTRDSEITVEANPGTLSLEYLEGLRQFDVNRLSLGLQATDNALLKSINRPHTWEEFLENYRHAQTAGFTNISVDLMFGLPSQTLAQWKDSLEKVMALQPQHISVYSLIPEEGTPLYTRLENKEIDLPLEAEDRQMYHMAIDMLTAAGYRHYEISNFAKPGFESRHNTNCWQRQAYVAFGLGASSFDGDTRRWKNTADMADYLLGDFAPQQVEDLTPEDIHTETMILGLRLTQGICQSQIPPQFIAPVNQHIREGLLENKNGHLCLTTKGLDLANQVFASFI